MKTLFAVTRRSRSSGLLLTPCVLALLLSLAAAPRADRDATPTHLQQAQQLVEGLSGAQENVYGGGKRRIVWEAGRCSARTVCSSFMTLLLQHSYGWTGDTFRAWMHSANPEADAYHDAIVERRDFKRILHVSALRPGDILAVKYTDGHVSRDGVEDTGHVMLVCAPPLPVDGGRPLVPGTQQYTVEVIDSSASGHGPTDTRHTPGGGLSGGIGRGVIRLYAGPDGRIAGYTWSDTHHSPYYSAPERDMVAGRLTARTADMVVL